MARWPRELDGYVRAALGHMNVFLSPLHRRMFLLALLSVWMGYILYPLPLSLAYLFHFSPVFKYVVLAMFIAVSVYPLDMNDLWIVLFVPLLILGGFELVRSLEARWGLPATVLDTVRDGGDTEERSEEKLAEKAWVKRQQAARVAWLPRPPLPLHGLGWPMG